MNNPKILIIDDEPQIRRQLKIALENANYTINESEFGKSGILFAANHPPDLIILDIGLPDINGLEVLKQLREWFNNPIIILSVMDEEAGIIQALDSGANDYLTKPFRTGELLARIRTALRNHQQEDHQQILIFEDIEIDLVARTVLKNKIQLKLTQTEYDLLQLFAKNHGKVLTHHYIIKEIWGPTFQTETQYLRVFVGQLRKKIEETPNNPQHIITESRIGYRFV